MSKGPQTPNYPRDRAITVREKQTVDLACQGYDHKQIAQLMGGISVETVKRHLANVYDKTGLSSKFELARKYARFNSDFENAQKRTLRLEQARLLHELASVEERLAILLED